jgi:subtilisin family serine protease
MVFPSALAGLLILAAGTAWGGEPPATGTCLIVKLSPGVPEAADRLVAQGRSFDSVDGLVGFDAVNRRYGLRAVRPLRGSDAAVASAAGRRAAERTRRARVPHLNAARAGVLPSFASTYVFELAGNVDPEEAARAYASHPSVVYAEPDHRREHQLLTDDPFLSSSGSWGQDFADLWGLHQIAAPAAWDIARGAGVIIAISDTGIDTAHPDLAASLWVNSGEIAGNGVDDDGNGYVDDLHGWNSVGDSADIFDDHGHGTHVAGIAAAVGDNGTGVVGVAFESRLMAVKGLDDDGFGFDSTLSEGILYAVENGAQVINASWGGGPRSQTLTDAIATAHAAEVVFVAAAGNNGTDVDNGAFPAILRTAITVAASDHLDQRASFSNRGLL